MGRERSRDVSCLALTLFFDYLERRGLSREPLLTELPYPADYLSDRTNWIDYATFQAIERRLADLVPDDPDVYFHAGLASSHSTVALALLRALVRSVLSPFQFYRAVPKVVPRFLFPHLHIQFERTSRNTLTGCYRFDEGYPPSEAWIETARGVLAGVPTRMGAPAARVSARRTGPLEVCFDIALDKRWLGPLDFVRRFVRRVFGVVRQGVDNLAVRAQVLEETNRLLTEKVDALTHAQSALRDKVRQLTLLNSLARTATSELELSRLVRNVVTVLAEQLDGSPVMVLLAEGDPPGLVAAAASGVDARSARRIARLGDPQAEVTRQLLVERQSARLEVAGSDWLLVPMVSHEKPVGALLLGAQAAGAEASLLEAMAGQLAVAIDNARSYQLVAELRDNLEVRVQERTLDLEAARDALATSVQQLERSDRAMRDFFTNVSHEFRTPLTLILAPLEELRAVLRRAGMDDSLPALDHIGRNARALLKLINEILDFAKLDARQMPVHPERFELGAFVTELVEELRPLAERKAMALTCQRPGLSIQVTVDPKLIRRAVVNLLSNAVKYCERGDAVTVRVLVDGEAATVEVADTGPGIPVEHRERIFERFQRVEDNRGQVVEGSGIGLAMVKEIVELHGGGIQLVSPPEGGSVFRLRLPVTSVSAAEGTTPAPTPDAEPDALLMALNESPMLDAVGTPSEPGLAPTDAPRVLLVEDNPEMRTFLRRLLGRRYRLLMAVDGVEGLELATRELPDLVLSDVMMPRLDGYSLCRCLKAERLTRNIPVMLISAMHGSEASVQGFEAGADDFVNKPFSPPELLARVEAQLRIRALQRRVMQMEKQTTLGTMAAGIAHEVLNPVNAVLTAVEPLRKRVQALDERDRRLATSLIDVVQSSGVRIRDVVKAMLGLARNSDSELRLRKSDLSEGIESTLTLLRHRIGGSVRVVCQLGCDEPVDCYPELLFQVVMNLVTNALDALGEEGGTVYIVTERDDHAVRIRVRDDGPGIPPDVRERIFAPFYTTKAPGAGTGLGLAVSREIADLHGGRLDLQSAPGRGAEFVFTLPVEQPLRAAS